MVSKRFEVISRDWLLSKQGVVKHLSYDKYEKVISKHLSYFNDKNIEKITEDEVDEFFNKKENEEKLSKSTLYTISHVLRSIFVYAKKEYQLNTINIINLKHDEKQRPTQILTKKEIDILNEYLLANKDAVSLAILLSLYAGLRTGEISALKKENIDLDNNVIHISKSVERIKTEKGTKLTILEPRSKYSLRSVPISKYVKKYLVDFFDCYPMESNYFILSTNENIFDTRTVQRKLQELCITLKIKTDFNALRNTFISYCLSHNMNIKCLCEIIGTSDFSGIYELCPDCSLDQKKNEINNIFSK
ncbi:tyrosine-type recombinase/integrase [Longibaculum muris]|uniref:Site-specific recombinase XerD n=1 Tax=Longibaculum muris TaxID=1796628 RepID=A0A4V2W5S2_9FIRM|nr:tyrosine-type recombinase/integrase [Longibaculum muris]KXU41683.1 site-specific recombinase, phage integrase family [Candidatus Stoquefichus sp. KLE1796]MBS5369433.1 tyrosine-type recombinase/integrase [Coprobacillus cateniformis]MCR1888153.1 site-specific integrase [Longibaculum muris]TCW01018.1 site-specific recombinase XerD [Longibaculum muris]